MNKIKYQDIVKQKGVRPITCLTAYTKSIAKILDGIVDIVLVGDSVGTAMYDMKNTQGVTLQMMKDHGKAVNQNIKKSLTIVDMPYNTYTSKKQALKNAKELLNYTKVNFIKIETDGKNIDIIKYLISKKINVVGHIGVTPQKFKDFKKIKSVGNNIEKSNSLLNLAINLEKIGVKLIVLECIKDLIAKKITNVLKIPTIGIGSSKYCDGQILVINDLLNYDVTEKKPKFIKAFANLNKTIGISVKNYKKEVINKKFPNSKQSYKL